jgi:signal transduction histidine kinase
MLAQIFSLLLEHVARAGSNDGLEIRVRWTDGVLVIDVYDAGRGIAKETYATLQKLVGRLQGTVVVTRELGTRSRVELSLPSITDRGSGATTAHREGR